MMDWTIAKLLEWATKYFSEKGIDSPRLDAELLLARALQLDRVQLYVQYDRPVVEAELQTFKPLVQRRLSREPLPYILGQKDFFFLNFKINSDVLIPRPETEELVAMGLTFLQARGSSGARLLDLATGSGCILTALLKNLPLVTGIGTDISPAALKVAQENAELHGVGDRAQWLVQDLQDPWPDLLSEPFDLVTANLPYVSGGDWGKCAPEITEFEPKVAFVTGPQGTEAFHWVLPQIPTLLRGDGLALFEMGMEQGESLQEMATQYCPAFKNEVLPDLAGKPRYLILRRA